MDPQSKSEQIPITLDFSEVRPPAWVRAKVVLAVSATARAGRKRAVRWDGGEGVIRGEGWAGRARGCRGEDGSRGRLRRRWRARRLFGVCVCVCQLFVDNQWSHQHPTPIFNRLCSVYVVVAPAGVCCGLCISIIFVVMCLSVAISCSFMGSVLV